MSPLSEDRFVREDLSGGLVVLTEEMPAVRSAAVGVWTRFGSVHESPEEMGIAHLLEHMVFKGTRRRSAREIALALERLGGGLDAYTTREHTSYQARVLDEHLAPALEVLSELVLEPQLRAEDLELERGVVLEEISTVEDMPEDLVFDIHSTELWGDHPYGYRILGTGDTVAAIDVDRLRAAHRRHYVRGNLVVAAAGNVRHEEVVARAAELFAAAPPGSAPPPVRSAAAAAPREVRVDRPTAQTHLVFGRSTFGHADPRRYALVLLSSAFGGGMSSRLFQRVREELGLAYSVYSFQSFYQDAGIWGVYVGTRHQWADHATAVVREEMARVATEGLEAEELEDAKGQVKGALVLGLESSGGRLHRLAGYALYDEPFLTLDELVARVDAVQRDDIAAVASEFLDPAGQLIVRLGPGE